MIIQAMARGRVCLLIEVSNRPTTKSEDEQIVVNGRLKHVMIECKQIDELW